MHPQLTLLNNEMCAEVILALQQCHKDVGFWGKLIGSCNEQKRVLDQCFRAQKKVKVKASLDEARKARERWKQECDAIDRRRAAPG